MKRSLIKSTLLTALLVTAGFAQADDHSAGAKAGAKAGVSVGVGGVKVGADVDAKADAKADMKGMEMTEGEVRKVDATRGKVTLKHGEIASMKMPPMTMVFNAKNAAMLDGLQKGDKVKFAVDADMQITVIEKQ